jgi:hypothetical protein
VRILSPARQAPKERLNRPSLIPANCPWKWFPLNADLENQIKQICYQLEEINKDASIPRNIRRMAKESKDILMDEKKQLDVRAALAISNLDKMVNDPNIPLHGRPLIWQIMSQLETMK